LRLLESEVRVAQGGDYDNDVEQFFARCINLLNLLREMIIPKEHVAEVVSKLRELGQLTNNYFEQGIKDLAEEIEKEYKS